MEHTATPWYSTKYDPTMIASEADPRGRTITATYGDDAEASANAAFIVRAVNSFDLNVTALRSIVSAKTLEEAKQHAEETLRTLQEAETD